MQWYAVKQGGSSTEKKNSRYFLNLERRKYEKKNIVTLKLNDGTETEDQGAILREEEKFYKTLYEAGIINTESPGSNVFFQNKVIKPLSDESANVCEGEISKEECLKALSEMKNDKSPVRTALRRNFTSVSGMKLETM